MKQIELSAGTIEYTDTGEGPVLLLLHGLMMDASLWDGTIADLSADHRCVAPTLPLGAHRRAMNPDADLSLPAIARLAAEFADPGVHARIRHNLAARPGSSSHRGGTLIGCSSGGASARGTAAGQLPVPASGLASASRTGTDSVPTSPLPARSPMHRPRRRSLCRGGAMNLPTNCPGSPVRRRPCGSE